jgi:hypothetical protein
MEELLELREYIEQQRYTEALDLVAELEEMSREDKINKIHSYGVILLLHLIKQQIEQRTTRSWDLFIYNTVHQIQRVNKRRKANGVYAPPEEMRDILAEAFPSALKRAALEALEGRYDVQELGQMVERATIEQRAMELINATQREQ